MVLAMERAAALGEFDSARDQFLAALAPVPDAALTYLRPGDIYAIGGLVVHCNWVFKHYGRVLDRLAEPGTAEFRTEDPSEEVEVAGRRALAGLSAGERGAELALLCGLHEDLTQAALKVPAGDWERKTPVLYGTAADPYPTSPDDIVGWLRDHYQEHVPHAAELLAEWQAARV
jgi:DinB superfamily